MPRTVKGTIGWTSEEGEDCIAEYEATGGSPGRLYGEPGDCYPPEAPEITILELVEDRKGGLKRPDLLAEADKDESLMDRIIEQLSEPPDTGD